MVRKSMVYRLLIKINNKETTYTNTLGMVLYIEDTPFGISYSDTLGKTIDKRPSIVQQKVRLDNFEMGIIVRKSQKGAILILMDRVTGYIIINEFPMGKRAKPLSRII